MDIQLIVVPYHLGKKHVGSGLGPKKLLAAGGMKLLKEFGEHVHMEEVAAPGKFQNETSSTFAVLRVLAERVQQARVKESFPLVLGGDCNSSIGMIAGLQERELGIIWFDAHGDFNTPESTGSGYLDGMPLAILTGKCWTTLSRTVPGFTPVEDSRIVLAGFRSLDIGERKLLQRSKINLIPAERMKNNGAKDAIESMLASTLKSCKRIYVHVDLDVIDPSHGCANEFAYPGGLSPQDLEDMFDVLFRSGKLIAASLTSYDPRFDKTKMALHTGLRIFRALLGKRRVLV